MRISDWSSDVCSSDLVHDEYGHFDGLVTPADLLSAIAGEFASDQDIGSEPFVVERDDGSLLIAGSMPADQMAERLGIELGEDRDYAPAAGHAPAILKHLPTAGANLTTPTGRASWRERRCA